MTLAVDKITNENFQFEKITMLFRFSNKPKIPVIKEIYIYDDDAI